MFSAMTGKPASHSVPSPFLQGPCFFQYWTEALRSNLVFEQPSFCNTLLLSINQVCFSSSKMLRQSSWGPVIIYGGGGTEEKLVG